MSGVAENLEDAINEGYEKIRTFDSGATRDSEEGKYDYEGFLSPIVVERYGRYMQVHRVQSDGSIRASDNWQKGIPLHAYIKSAFRHFLDWWRCHRGFQTGVEEALCALMFNTMGYLHVVLVKKRQKVEKERKELLHRLDSEPLNLESDLFDAADAYDKSKADLVRDFE